MIHNTGTNYYSAMSSFLLQLYAVNLPYFTDTDLNYAFEDGVN